MTALLARLIAGAILSAASGAAANYLGSPSCPGDAASWVCQNWALVAAVGGFACGVLGHPVVKRAAQARSALAASSPVPAPTVVDGVEVEPASFSTRSNEEIEADEKSGFNGSGG